MSTTPQFITQLNQAARSLKSSLHPWSTFLDLSSFNLPSSIPDATTRITQNLTHFRSNYALLTSILLLLTLIFHPLALIAFFLTAVAWLSLYLFRDEPLSVFGFEISDLVVLVALSFVTVLVVIWSGVWLSVVVAVAVGGGVVVLHAVLRSTDDLVADDIETSPYANLLSDEDSPRLGL